LFKVLLVHLDEAVNPEEHLKSANFLVAELLLRAQGSCETLAEDLRARRGLLRTDVRPVRANAHA
jgi:hypothetical protein